LSQSILAADEDDSDTSSSEDDLLTVKDAVTHIVRSTRHSRANSNDHLDQLEDHKEASPSDRPDPRTAADPLATVRGVTFSDAGHISLSGASSLPPLATRRAPGGSKEASEMNGGGITARSESSEAWSEERIRQLEEDKAAIERLWGEHAQENDIGVLKFKLVCSPPIALANQLCKCTKHVLHNDLCHPQDLLQAVVHVRLVIC